MLVAECLSVHYGDKLALNNVSLKMLERQVTALIGPSGCGKSTFLRALNRMHELGEGTTVSGQVLLHGVDVLAPEVDAVEVRRRIGMVFQRPNPLAMSIFDNVAFGLRVAGERDHKKLLTRVEEVLQEAALWEEVKDRLGKSAFQLSGGQQQRLCIARAIAVRPTVLLLDEPASALDPASTERVEALIIKLRAVYTVVLVTHSLPEAARVADSTAVFYAGELIEFGPTAQLFAAPQHARTRDYLRGHVGSS